EPVVDADLPRRSKTPVIAFECLSRLPVLNVSRQLKCFAGFLRRGDEAQKFARLAPEIFPATPGDVFQSAGRPIRNRRENCRLFGCAIRFPKIGHDRLPGRVPFESVRWNRKTFRADVFTKREEGVVTAEIVDCRSYT